MKIKWVRIHLRLYFNVNSDLMRSKYILFFLFLIDFVPILASDGIATVFLYGAANQAVYVYKSSLCNKTIAEVKEDSLLENWHEVKTLSVISTLFRFNL